tara:strand:- start:608 stop:1084 length:477 start_codon:yes stop_codon:yes gene_type:complete
MNYPEKYKAQTMYITKFEKNVNKGSRLDYLFVNAFPKIINATPISYGGADILRVGVQFNYDRYIVNPQGSISKGSAPNDTPFIKSLDAAREEREARRAPSAELQERSEAAAAPAAPVIRPEQKRGLAAARTERTTSLDLYKPGGRLSRFNADGTLKTR